MPLSKLFTNFGWYFSVFPIEFVTWEKRRAHNVKAQGGGLAVTVVENRGTADTHQRVREVLYYSRILLFHVASLASNRMWAGNLRRRLRLTRVLSGNSSG